MLLLLTYCKIQTPAFKTLRGFAPAYTFFV